MKIPPLIRLSQSHLNLLEICPPMFQRQYLDNLEMPLNAEIMEKGMWGNQFHLLMQQQEIGLSLQALSSEEPALIKSVEALLTETASLWQGSYLLREAEHHRTVTIEQYLLTVIYDLLVLETEKATIIDWKTFPQPEKKDKLMKNWQTRLYLYVLAETSNYPPEHISMTYWFVKLPNKPKSLTFNYDSKQHQKNHQDLHNLLDNLSQYLNKYEQDKSLFPHSIHCEKTCPHAQFLLNSDIERQPNQSLLDNIDAIEEIAI
ncbi:MAG: PD-(D/E)XK nuclease family protein [Microcystaceae cyanobacterium]